MMLLSSSNLRRIADGAPTPLRSSACTTSPARNPKSARKSFASCAVITRESQPEATVADVAVFQLADVIALEHGQTNVLGFGFQLSKHAVSLSRLLPR